MNGHGEKEMNTRF